MSHYRSKLAIWGASVFVICAQWPGQAAAQVSVDVGGVHIRVGEERTPPPPPPPTKVVVLTRGPVHEAFAQPVVFDEGERFTITRRPPAPLEEDTPDYEPEGSQFVWIPGYWSWDGEWDDFIWVSGCWRAVPPESSWVPGYWAQSGRGYRWIAGFWTTADTDEIEYLPEPPATLEEGPRGPPGPADSIWVPGSWVRHQNRYAWRPGFWEEARPNWVWVPAQYIATPRGWVYVDGYWDYSLERRGVAFLPIYCPPRLYARPDFRYSPAIVLDLDVLTVSLFTSPRRHHYYFGDYYAPEYSREGFYPWYDATDRHDRYDPIFVHERWRHRDDRKWLDTRRQEYEHRRDDKALRPARTYDAMTAHVDRLPEKDRRQAQAARPMKEVVAEKRAPFKFVATEAKTREARATRTKDMNAYRDKRSQWEAPAAAPKEPIPKELPKRPADEVKPPQKPEGPEHGWVPRDVEPQKVKIPRPPIAIREPARDKELTPPPRPKQPKADPDAKPRPSKSGADDRSRDKSDKDKADKDRSDKDRSDRDKSDKDKRDRNESDDSKGK